MKTTFPLKFTFIMAILCATFASCSSNDDDEKSKEESPSIVGTWHMNEINIDNAHSWTQNTITFNEDGTLVREDSVGYASLGLAGGYPIFKTSDGQYTYNANTGILSTIYKPREGGNSWSQTYNVVELTRQRLVLSGVDNNYGNFTFFYNRIK